MNFKFIFSDTFHIPLIVLLGIIVYIVLAYINLSIPANLIILSVITIGSFGLFKETYKSLLEKHFALDYIAIIAIIVAVYSNQYLVAAILALMISSGKTLEEYAVSQAKKSLTNLIDRIPDKVYLWVNNKIDENKKICEIKIGQQILIRKGEVVALDGILVSKVGLTDESTLTGEPYFIEKIKGDQIRSGTLNIGEPIVISVTRTEENSTYNKIIELVLKAQKEKSPLVRLADKYSTVFTAITFGIAGFAYFYSGYNLSAVLSVLAIATPCPLIIATPIALLGGINSAAKKRIIIKRLASLEILSRVTSIILDKTGTITVGQPKLSEIKIVSDIFSQRDILAIATAIERNSLHPLAKAIVNYAKTQKTPLWHVDNLKEEIGKGISGKVKNKIFMLSKTTNSDTMSIELKHNNQQLAIFTFEDEIKEDSNTILNNLKDLGLHMSIFTGDKRGSAEKIAKQISIHLDIKAECTPEEKQNGIKMLQKQGHVTAMIGDGINDAPSLALADVGLVFSNEEQTAASQAADIVFLGGNFSSVLTSFQIAKRTIYIAKQSIFWGIGLSITGMTFASLGYVPPIYGAVIQEFIDVAVIINALRASK